MTRYRLIASVCILFSQCSPEPESALAGEPASVPSSDSQAGAASLASEVNVKEEWEFYMCRVNDQLASVSVDMALKAQAPSSDRTQLYVARITMVDGSPHRMGSMDEMLGFAQFQNALLAAAREGGFEQTGRMRSGGYWRLYFMGKPGCGDAFLDLSEKALSGSGREFEAQSKADPDWSHYLGFLYPNANQIQMISDRKVVKALQDRGDPLTTPRRVDHWIYFKDSESRNGFVKAVEQLGFECITLKPGEGALLGLQVHRVDEVQLDSIHEVVMSLVRLAEEWGSEYDGWETYVETK